MYVFLVYGVIQYEGTDLIKVFSNEESAQQFKLLCEQYDEQAKLLEQFSTQWYDFQYYHPGKKSAFYTYYTITEEFAYDKI